MSTPTLTLPPAFAEAATRRQASKGEGIYRGNFKNLWLAFTADEKAFAPLPTAGRQSMGARQTRSDTPLIKIYIARHGETTWNVEKRIQGRSDPGLSPKGYAQSLALIEQLKDRPISAIYTSTLQRSILTAQPIAKLLNLPIQKQPELDEMAFGIMEGVQISSFNEELIREWERFKENRFTYHIPGAENYTDVATRLKPFKEKILRDHTGQEVLIIGHMIVNRFLIGMLLEVPLEEIQRMEQHNGFVYLVERNGEARVSHFIDGEIREGFIFAPPNDPIEHSRRS